MKQVIGTAKSDFASVVQLLLDARVDPNCSTHFPKHRYARAVPRGTGLTDG